jgi:hypothetical protein
MTKNKWLATSSGESFDLCDSSNGIEIYVAIHVQKLYARQFLLIEFSFVSNQDTNNHDFIFIQWRAMEFWWSM